MSSLRIAIAIGAAVVLARVPPSAADKPEPKKDVPKITCVAPLAVVPGKTSTIRLRGVGLDQATGFAIADLPAEALKLKEKKKSEPPKPFEAARIGDTELTADATIPKDAKPGPRAVTVTTPAGTTAAFEILIIDPATAVDEKEPNGGFKQAQPIAPGHTVIGLIDAEKDVDVFRIEAKAGRTIVARVRAASAGSPLDPALTLYDANGRTLATADDASATDRDADLRFKVPADGVYYLCLQDANDRGTPVHAYRLDISEE
ncbi:MAG: PPC domain-containing protein [Phycisphaerae bacterium]|nr:PPC domain-containing protein [Tepidisphaeraceae bacterium]